MEILNKINKEEKMETIDYRIKDWFRGVRLSGRERDDIEAIIEDLKALINY